MFDTIDISFKIDKGTDRLDVISRSKSFVTCGHIISNAHMMLDKVVLKLIDSKDKFLFIVSLSFDELSQSYYAFLLGSKL